MPPIFTEPVSTGLNGSDTSRWSRSPVPQHDTYRKRSSSDRLMSLTSGGTAPNPLRRGGRSSAAAGSAGISMTLRIRHVPDLLLPSRYHVQIDDDRSLRLVTTPTKPYVSLGSCAGRSSSTI